MSKKPHIVFLCSRLDLPGGIERAIINQAELFIANEHQVSLVILDETAGMFYPVNTTINVIQQPLSFGITKEGNILSRKIKLLSDVLKLRGILKKLKPGMVIATEYPFTTAAVLTGLRKHINPVSWEHHHYHELIKSGFWKQMEKLTYPRLAAIVCLNNDEKKYYKKLNERTEVIPNFVSTDQTLRLPTSDFRPPIILTIARLAKVKGIDLLLQTAKLVLQKHPGWRWKIIGEGEMAKESGSFIKAENLQDRLIIQPPVSHNIYPEYQNASIYVMTSRNECFPMTLLEAMSAGLPCIAFDCETGPRHIIKNKINGILVEKENIRQLAEALSTLINDEDQRKKMGENANSTVQQFSPEKNYELWKQLFN